MPATHAAFLRGINLGRRRVTNDDLAAPFRALGFRDVATFLASGNVVFDPGPAGDPGPDSAALAARIEARLADDLGFPVRVFLRTAAELTAIIARDPFTAADHARSTGKLQVTLLPRAPDAATAAAALGLAPAADRLAIHGTELYWLPAANMSASDLDLTALDRLVGPGTTRTHNTLARLQEKFFHPEI